MAFRNMNLRDHEGLIISLIHKTMYIRVHCQTVEVMGVSMRLLAVQPNIAFTKAKNYSRMLEDTAPGLFYILQLGQNSQ